MSVSIDGEDKNNLCSDISSQMLGLMRLFMLMPHPEKAFSTKRFEEKSPKEK